MPCGQRKPRGDRDVAVEVLTRIRKAEAAPGPGKRLQQLGRGRFAETPPMEVRFLDEQDTITRARREKSENAASRSGAGDREVVHGHRIHAKARKLVRTAFMPSMLPGLFFSSLLFFLSSPPAWKPPPQPGWL